MTQPTDTITIGTVRDGHRLVIIDPPLVCQPSPPSATVPFWRAWVDLLETSVVASSRTTLPWAIETALLEHWHRCSETGSHLVTRSDRRLGAALCARIHEQAA